MKKIVKFAVAFLTSTLLGANPGGNQILVGPDALAVSDSSMPHVEMMLAAHPTDAKQLLAASIVITGGSLETHVYTSEDGGGSWATSVPGQSESGDPQVAYGPDGSAYYAFLQDTAKGSLLDFYRSRDRGATWVGHAIGRHVDHPQMLVDESSSRYRGRIYIAALLSKYPRYTVGVFRSSDGGRTFDGPVQAWSVDDGKHGINCVTPVVFGDGTFMVFFEEFPLGNVSSASSTMTFFGAQSTTGGLSFGKPVRIGQQNFGSVRQIVRWHETHFSWMLFPQCTIDSSEGPYRDRLYCVWNNFRSGKPRLYITSSADRGATWSPLRPIGASDAGEQYQPAVAVNNRGVVAVTWFDTRGSSDSYEEMVTASLDGGKSFMPSRALSSARSFPRGAGNLGVAVVNSHGTPGNRYIPSGRETLTFDSAFNRWPHGGDYTGLTSDASGMFHAFWADARTGTFEPWTAPFVVGTRPDEPALRPTNITNDVDLKFSLVNYDAARHEYAFDVRIKNVSSRPIYGPMSVYVTSLQNPYAAEAKTLFPEDIPVILNASNGKRGIGAEFDYAHAFGDFQSLNPGKVSSAVRWTLRMGSAARPTMMVRVNGYVAKPG